MNLLSIAMHWTMPLLCLLTPTGAAAAAAAAHASAGASGSRSAQKPASAAGSSQVKKSPACYVVSEQLYIVSHLQFQ